MAKQQNKKLPNRQKNLPISVLAFFDELKRINNNSNIVFKTPQRIKGGGAITFEIKKKYNLKHSLPIIENGTTKLVKQTQRPKLSGGFYTCACPCQGANFDYFYSNDPSETWAPDQIPSGVTIVDSCYCSSTANLSPYGATVSSVLGGLNPNCSCTGNGAEIACSSVAYDTALAAARTNNSNMVSVSIPPSTYTLSVIGNAFK
jgi:hypothetical protein